MSSIRAKYAEDIDFSVLALQSPAFAKFIKPNGQLNFSDPRAVQQLTKSLLKRDFALDLELPDDRLCPPVPNRLNYIFWLQDLLDTSSESYKEEYEAQREVVGLDIGTGASCIYPLLGCSLRPNWRFVGTDIDEKSLAYARKNVTRNNLTGRIKLIATHSDASLIPLDALSLSKIDFLMCNPPFYSSQDELLSLAAQKSRPPFSACTGSASEMITPGGELAFAVRLLNESVRLRTRVQWYTTMFGKLSSVIAFLPQMKDAGVHNWAVTEFMRGGPGKTRRWGVGWSWAGRRCALHVARGAEGLDKKLLPFPSEYNIHVASSGDTETCLHLGQRVDDLLSTLELLQWKWRAAVATGVGFAGGNVWSRASRRKAARPHHRLPDTEMKDAIDSDEDDAEPALGFKIRILPATGTDAAASTTPCVQIRWLLGQDAILFESFCGMIKRKLTSL